MKPFEEHVAADRRLIILKLLAMSGGYKMNEYSLYETLPSFGHDVPIDTVRTDFAWLEEQGLASIEMVASVRIATLTERGLDVQAGRANQPGVKRPRPGE